MSEKNISEQNKFIEEIEDETVEFREAKKERTLVPLKKENIRKRKDGYFTIRVKTNARERMAIVPQDTIERLINEKTSLRVLKDRYNTLSAPTQTFDKPLMYYAIAAYNKVPREEYESWKTATPLLKYELIHLNGDLDDIREENIKLTYKDTALWEKIKEEYKRQNKTGANIEYAKQREQFFKTKIKDSPNLKIMVRIIDPVKKTKTKGDTIYDAEAII